MSERTVQKANYLGADTVQELNDQHGWFQYEDAQSDVSRAFANNAIHLFLGIAIEAEQTKQETGMSPRELAKHISDLESRIVELEKENASLKKGVQRLDFILDHVCIDTPVNSTCWYSLIGLDVSGDFYQREGSVRELFVSDVDEAIKEFNA